MLASHLPLPSAGKIAETWPLFSLYFSHPDNPIFPLVLITSTTTKKESTILEKNEPKTVKQLLKKKIEEDRKKTKTDITIVCKQTQEKKIQDQCERSKARARAQTM